MGYFDVPIPPEVHKRVEIYGGSEHVCDSCHNGTARVAWDQAHPGYEGQSELGFEYRIEYTYPYLENQGQTQWAGPATSLEGAKRDVNRWTEGYGRHLTVQKRTVVRSEWRSI